MRVKSELLQKKLVKQAVRYLLVGLSSAAIEVLLFWLLHQLLLIDTLIANPVAILMSTLYNFSLSYKWSFSSTSSLPRTIVLYLLLFAFNQFFSTFAIIQLETMGMNAILAKVATMACIVLWNFVLYRKVIFK